MDGGAGRDPRRRRQAEAVTRVQHDIARIGGLQRNGLAPPIGLVQPRREERGAQAETPVRGVHAERRELPGPGWPRRQLGREEGLQAVAQQAHDPGLVLVGGSRCARRQQSRHPLDGVVDQDDAAGEGVAQVDRLQLLESGGVLLLGDRPARPWIVVEGDGEGAGGRRDVGDGGFADGILHGVTVVHGAAPLDAWPGRESPR